MNVDRVERERARRPAIFLKKKITFCQTITMARAYGWQMGMTNERDALSRQPAFPPVVMLHIPVTLLSHRSQA